MPSLTTIYRAVVMLAAGVILVIAWRHYGPSAERLKAGTAWAIEMAYAAWNPAQPPARLEAASLAAEPHQAPPAFSPVVPFSAPDFSGPRVAPARGDPLAPPVLSPESSTDGLAAGPDTMAVAATDDTDRLPELLQRLEALGGTDPRLSAWGSTGQLHRFCCRAALTHAPSLSRHFEAVADEPEVAIQQVVAKVEAWRMAQRDKDRPQ